MVLQPGRILGAYRIDRLVGRGGMGAVYLADDIRLGRQVALKILAAELAADPSIRDRFVHESRTAAALDHPHILPIYEAGEIDGELFIAMRYVPGPDLGGIVERDGPLPLERTVGLIDQIASALDAAHAAGLVHRDVKPGNILVVSGSTPGTDHAYLTDFGLTKQIGDGPQLTKTGQLLGSVGYVAPEQIEGRAVDRRADVYSLGCVVFECLSGIQPYRRDTEMATLYAHATAPPPSLVATRPELPPGIDQVIATAMAKEPDQRFPAAGDLASALSAAAAPDAATRRLTRGFLFADLRGYTAFVEAHGDADAARLLEAYRRLVRDVTLRYGGAEIKTEGDSFYLVFPSASDAVRCGLAIVAAAAAESSRNPDRPIDVGVGVHAGESTETSEGYVGSAVNIAARVCAEAHAGEVLVTDTVRGLTRTSGGIAFAPRGQRTLKGIVEPVTVFAATTGAIDGTASSSTAVVPGAGTRPRIGSRRSRVVLAIVAFVGVTLVAAVGFRALQPGQAATPTLATQPGSSVAASGGLGLGSAGPSAEPGAAAAGVSPAAGSGDPSLAASPRLAIVAPDAGDGSWLPTELESGRWTWEKFTPHVSFDVATGWDAMSDGPDGAELADYGSGGYGQGPPLGEIGFLRAQVVLDRPCYLPEVTRALGDRPIDFMDWLTKHPLLKAGNVQPVNVAGRPGLAVDVSLRRDKTAKDCPDEAANAALLRRIPLFPAAEHAFLLFNGDRARIVAVDVGDGPPLLMILRAPAADWEPFEKDASPIVESLGVTSP